MCITVSFYHVRAFRNHCSQDTAWPSRRPAWALLLRSGLSVSPTIPCSWQYHLFSISVLMSLQEHYINEIIQSVTFGDRSFVQHNILEVHSSCYVSQNLIHFYCKVVFHGMELPSLFSHSPFEDIWLFPIWGYYKYSCCEVMYSTGFCTDMFPFSGPTSQKCNC